MSTDRPHHPTDSRTVDEHCIVCGSWTRSHPVPNSWLCHTCLTERDETTILDALPVAPVPDVDADTQLECHWCGGENTPRAVNTPGKNFVVIAVHVTPFDRLEAVLIVSCPQCGHATEHLTTEDAALELSDAVGLEVRDLAPRHGRGA